MKRSQANVKSFDVMGEAAAATRLFFTPLIAMFHAFAKATGRVYDGRDGSMTRGDVARGIIFFLVWVFLSTCIVRIAGIVS